MIVTATGCSLAAPEGLETILNGCELCPKTRLFGKASFRILVETRNRSGQSRLKSRFLNQ